MSLFQEIQNLLERGESEAALLRLKKFKLSAPGKIIKRVKKNHAYINSMRGELYGSEFVKDCIKEVQREIKPD